MAAKPVHEKISTLWTARIGRTNINVNGQALAPPARRAFCTWQEYCQYHAFVCEVEIDGLFRSTSWPLRWRSLRVTSPEARTHENHEKVETLEGSRLPNLLQLLSYNSIFEAFSERLQWTVFPTFSVRIEKLELLSSPFVTAAFQSRPLCTPVKELPPRSAYHSSPAALTALILHRVLISLVSSPQVSCILNFVFHRSILFLHA